MGFPYPKDLVRTIDLTALKGYNHIYQGDNLSCSEEWDVTANEDGVRHEFLLDGVKILRDAWGKVTLIKGENILIGAINPYRYRGYYFDHETGLYYLQSRYYNPQIGRFINGDAAEFVINDNTLLACNLFNYCGNSPMNSTDSNGNFSSSVFTLLIKNLSRCVEGLSKFIINMFGLSKAKYKHKLKYNNATSLTKFVNNKVKIRKVGRGFSAIRNCLEIILIISECYSKIKHNVSYNSFKTIVSLLFVGIKNILANVLTKVISWLISLIVYLRAFKPLIELVLGIIIDWIFEGKWINKIEAKFFQIADKNKMTIGNYIVNLIKATKLVYA